MKTKMFFGAALTLLLGISMTANATLTTTVVVENGPFGTGSGGLFTVTRTSGSDIPAGSIDTFCIELNELVGLGNTYYIELSDSAKGGGIAGQNAQGVDPLDPKTAALFRKWRSLATPTHELADLYQLAIWFVEEEVTYRNNQWERNDNTNTPVGGPYTLILQQDVLDLIDSVGNPSTLGSVQVMRLWANADGTGARQDMLWIPAPGAVLLGMIGMGLLASLKRRG